MNFVMTKQVAAETFRLLQATIRLKNIFTLDTFSRI